MHINNIKLDIQTEVFDNKTCAWHLLLFKPINLNLFVNQTLM